MIREATPEDADRIFALLEKEGRVAYTLDLVRDLIGQDDSLSLVDEDDGEIVGALGARAEGKNSAWLYYLITSQKRRGEGRARALFEELKEQARERGIKRLALDTPDCSFFEHLGFTEVGRIPDWYEDKDQVIMFLALE